MFFLVNRHLIHSRAFHPGGEERGGGGKDKTKALSFYFFSFFSFFLSVLVLSQSSKALPTLNTDKVIYSQPDPG